jgi:hypothetical protein
MPTVSIEAMNKHLEQTSGQNQQMRQRQCHRPADPRRCRLAQFAATHRAREYRAPLPPYAPELNSVDPSTGSGHMGLSAQQLSQPLRL